MTENPNKVNKALEIAKLVNADVQSLMLKMFAQAECTDELKASNPKEYFEKSNNILAAIVGCASQMALTDGLPHFKLRGKIMGGSSTGWELFLHNNPAIAEKVMAEKEAKKAAQQASMATYFTNHSKEDGDESSEDESEDES